MIYNLLTSLVSEMQKEGSVLEDGGERREGEESVCQEEEVRWMMGRRSPGCHSRRGHVLASSELHHPTGYYN